MYSYKGENSSHCIQMAVLHGISAGKEICSQIFFSARPTTDAPRRGTLDPLRNGGKRLYLRLNIDEKCLSRLKLCAENSVGSQENIEQILYLDRMD